jgi:hypothetical protein
VSDVRTVAAAGVPVPANPSDFAAPSSSNTAAQVVCPATSGSAHVLSGVAFSYAGSGTISGGNLLVQDGSATVFSLDVESKGTYFVPFFPPMRASPGAALTVTLAAGGSNVSGKVNLLGHYREQAGDDQQLGQFDFRYWRNNAAQAAIL